MHLLDEALCPPVDGRGRGCRASASLIAHSLAQRRKACTVAICSPPGAVGMKADSLVQRAWQSLFPRALMLTDDISRYGGIADLFWTFGGGNRVDVPSHRHRLSKGDIDILCPIRSNQALSPHG